MIRRHLISPHLAIIAQIYKLYGYGQYKMHRGVIKVPTNGDEVQPHLPHDETTIGVSFN
jgi:hypothetical protein